MEEIETESYTVFSVRKNVTKFGENGVGALPITFKKLDG